MKNPECYGQIPEPAGNDGFSTFSNFFGKRLIFHRSFYLQAVAIRFAERFQQRPICIIQLFRLILRRIMYGDTLGVTTIFEDIPCIIESVWHSVQGRSREESGGTIRSGYHTRLSGRNYQNLGCHWLFGRPDRQRVGQKYRTMGIWQRRQTERSLHQDQFGFPERIRHLYIVSSGGASDGISL